MHDDDPAVTPEAVARRLHSAQLAERDHRLPDALTDYMLARVWQDAARILSHMGRFYEAGLVLMLSLPDRETQVRYLSADGRRRCLDAALCFARGGARREAVGLLLNLGERTKAANLLVRAGLKSEAVQAMRGEPVPDNPWSEGVVFPLKSADELTERYLREQAAWQAAPPPLQAPSLDTGDSLAEMDAVDPGDPSAAGGAPGHTPSEFLPPPRSSRRRGWGTGEEHLPSGEHATRHPDDFRSGGYAWSGSSESPRFSARREHSGESSWESGPRELEPGGRRDSGPSSLGDLLDDELDAYGDDDLPRGRSMRRGGSRYSTESPLPTPPGGSALRMGLEADEFGDPPEEDLFPRGMLIGDRFVMDEKIGAGGMATVYRVFDRELHEDVALKLFRVVVEDPVRLRRFRREMKIHRRLIHPNIVRTYDFGTWRGARFITMELMEGEDLGSWVRQVPVLDTGVALQLMMQAVDGLGHAHSEGIVHRDVKPANLFVLGNGRRLKVMDFGVAKAVDSSSISITGVRVGTPRYMSPEQIQGNGVIGPPADLYALGAVMYEVFTGSPVFEDEELMPLLLNHLTEEPIPPREVDPTIPREVEEIILRLLAKNPKERYADAAGLKSALLRAYVSSQRL